MLLLENEYNNLIISKMFSIFLLLAKKAFLNNYRSLKRADNIFDFNPK